MSARPTAHQLRSGSSRRRPSGAAAERRRSVRRRRLAIIVVALLAAAVGAVTLAPQVHHAAEEISLPLRHEDVIRQQAQDKGLSPELIAAVIYTESRFRDETSPAGAKGLMQITPDTAKFIAQKSGGSAFELRDLGTPQINIAYGSWYLRYLLDRYGENELLALAAYNGGEGNVDRWLGEHGAAGREFTADTIPFPETRHYVQKVEEMKGEYRARYPAELGL
ncbi:MAG: lytic transglycosylase domain-containing protein [Solirubrobacteraceae bacterium]|nr:lytic transglycosylase domain-containing protein [Solirubrobacteraceae bacterium]